MGVTKPLIAFGVCGMLALAACSVDLSESTPGAAGSCAPTIAESNDFNDNVFTPDIVSNGLGCASCHESGTPTVTGYKYPVPATIVTDADKAENYCYHYRYGTLLIDFPRSSTHANKGTPVTSSDIPNLINWVNSNYP